MEEELEQAGLRRLLGGSATGVEHPEEEDIVDRIAFECAPLFNFDSARRVGKGGMRVGRTCAGSGGGVGGKTCVPVVAGMPGQT